MLRPITHFAFRCLAEARTCPSKRRCDESVFRVFSKIARVFGYEEASTIAEPWFLDSAYLLAEAVLATPSGAEIQFPWPMVVSLSTTNYCSHGCTICVSNSVANLGRRSIPLSSVSTLASTPIPHFILSGGEPGQSHNLKEITNILLSAKKDVYVATASSARSLAPVFEKYPNQVTILVSFWGEPRQHDEIRGEGSYQRALATIEELRNLPVRCSINYVVTESGTSALHWITKVASQLPAHRIFITRKIEFGRGAATTASHHDSDLSKEIRRLQQQDRRIVYGIPSTDAAPWHQRLAESLIGLKLPRDCGAATWAMHVDHRGVCQPCFASRPSEAPPPSSTLEFHKAWRALQSGRARTNRQLVKKDACRAEQITGATPFAPQ